MIKRGTMKNAFTQQEAWSTPGAQGLGWLPGGAGGRRGWCHSGIAPSRAPSADQAAAAAPPSVAVSAPLQREVDTRIQCLGPFSALEDVELRAQVGGTLTNIGFSDGEIVRR